MTPKSTLAFFLLLSCLTLGSTLQERYIRQDSGDYDAEPDCSENFEVAYPQCANNPGLKAADTETMIPYLVCDPNCGMLYLSYLVAQCPDKETVEYLDYIRGYCKSNAYGIPCYMYNYLKHKDSEFDTMRVAETAFLFCKPSIKDNMCRDECSSHLRLISTYYGSCIDPLFNSSYFHSANVEYLPAFSYQLWTRCGVPIPATAASRGRAKINTIYY